MRNGSLYGCAGVWAASDYTTGDRGISAKLTK